MFICTKCFELTSQGLTTQKCLCEPGERGSQAGVDCPSGVHLCCVCARVQVGGLTRYSWEACDVCRKANTYLVKRGSPGLGRHSFMNGLAVSYKDFENDTVDQKAMELAEFFNVHQSLKKWRIQIARELWKTIVEWSNRKLIPIVEWEARFPPSFENSLTMLREYRVLNG
jgi:hypothetical protein